MHKVRILISAAAAILLAALWSVLKSTRLPLGVRGEWEWLRLAKGPAPLDVVFAALAALGYAVLAAAGLRLLQRSAGPAREALAVAILLAASVIVQAIVPVGAPEGYGLARWGLVLHLPASTGYYTVAKAEISDARRFLADYPEWIRRQDALHIGTHPPGLFLVEHGLLRFFAARPRLARAAVEALPATVNAGLRAIDAFDPLPLSDRAALGVTGALTLLACAATVAPLYLLARATLPAPGAWSAAALWPLVPAAVLFQPLSDTFYPFLAALALALAAHAAKAGGRGRAGLPLAAGAGAVLAVGMAFSLAFLAVGLVAGLVLVAGPSPNVGRRIGLLLATGAGFLVPTLAFWWATGANPFLIWWWNQRNHARFYAEYHRTYGAWLLVNPLELGLALGIPASVWALAGLASARSAPRVAWATAAVLGLLMLSWRNLSEVARLWLPFMPGLLTAAGFGLARLGAGPRTLLAALLLQGAGTLLLQAMIQVVYPI